ncbi:MULTISPECIES: hypothetical protein [Actinoplanes]|uniref:hypothetical protein n=1 Tax=Actinoplanes TaxID=1865 RepID=UPI000AA9610F|nr:MULTISPECIES: hypothetical protein [Actinoplanes]GLX99918.1 hypothetical protein Acsp01_02980 [Actinoplanes sp. NBRC 101535]
MISIGTSTPATTRNTHAAWLRRREDAALRFTAAVTAHREAAARESRPVAVALPA